MAHRAPRPSDTGAGAGRRPREGSVTMRMGRASITKGRKGSQRRFDEGGRYLGIPQNGGLAAPRTGSDDADAHNSGLLSVQETGCGTGRFIGFSRAPRGIAFPPDTSHRPRGRKLLRETRKEKRNEN